MTNPPHCPWWGGRNPVLSVQLSRVQLVSAETGKCPPVSGTLVAAAVCSSAPWALCTEITSWHKGFAFAVWVE